VQITKAFSSITQAMAAKAAEREAWTLLPLAQAVYMKSFVTRNITSLRFDAALGMFAGAFAAYTQAGVLLRLPERTHLSSWWLIAAMGLFALWNGWRLVRLRRRER
jgi:hypothetical protein